MQKPFSATAEKLSAVMSRLLGWTPEQFWRATPAELAGILSAYASDDDGNSQPLGSDQLTKLKDKYPDG